MVGSLADSNLTRKGPQRRNRGEQLPERLADRALLIRTRPN